MEFKNIPHILNEPRFFSLVEKIHENLLMETDYGYFQELATHKNGFRITRKAWESGTRSLIPKIKHAIIKELEVAIDKEYIVITNKENNLDSITEFRNILTIIKAEIKKQDFLKFCLPIIKQIDTILNESKLPKQDLINNLVNDRDKRIVCNLDVSVLGQLINDIRELKIPGTDMKCIETKPHRLCQIIQKVFIQASGEEYSLASLETYIRNTRPKKVKRDPSIQVKYEA